MRYRLNRAQWVLSGLIALLLALTAGLVFLVHSGQTMGNGEEVKTGEFDAVPSPPPPPFTARNGYEDAITTAQTWASDAQLWTAQATWTVGSDLHAPPTAWNYTFYSPDRGASALINATSGDVKLLRTRSVSDVPELADVSKWQIDSPEAFELLYASGGEAFLTVHPKHTMLLTLEAEQPLRWQATLIDEGAIGNRAGRQVFSLVFSAQNGQLITRAVPGDTNG